MKNKKAAKITRVSYEQNTRRKVHCTCRLPAIKANFWLAQTYRIVDGLFFGKRQNVNSQVPQCNGCYHEILKAHELASVICGKSSVNMLCKYQPDLIWWKEKVKDSFHRKQLFCLRRASSTQLTRSEHKTHLIFRVWITRGFVTALRITSYYVVTARTYFERALWPPWRYVGK